MVMYADRHIVVHISIIVQRFIEYISYIYYIYFPSFFGRSFVFSRCLYACACAYACMCHILFLKRCHYSLAYYFHSSSTIRMHFVLCFWFVLNWFGAPADDLCFGIRSRSLSVSRSFIFQLMRRKNGTKEKSSATNKATITALFLIPHRSVAVSIYSYKHCCFAIYYYWAIVACFFHLVCP